MDEHRRRRKSPPVWNGTYRKRPLLSKFECDIVLLRFGVIEPHHMALLAQIEALTIFRHSPPYNSKHIWQYDDVPLHVQNWGSRGSLLAEYTSHWTGRSPR